MASQAKPAAPAPKRSVLLTSEDWWSVYLGLFLVLGSYVAVLLKSPLTILTKAFPAEWPKSPLFQTFANHIGAYALMFVILIVLTTIAIAVMGGKTSHYVGSFLILLAASLVIAALGSQHTLKYYGLEYPFWALILGLIVGNIWTLPDWFKAAAGRTEFFIKTAIVLLGANLSFRVIISGGARGFLEALVVVAIGFTTAFLIAKKMGYDNKFAATLGAGGSVCGVSAAIAVGGSVKAKEKEVGYVVSLVVLYALVLIFVLPVMGRLLGLSDVVTGAWIGGSELADAAGLASAAMVSDTAVKAFTLVKLNRDVMIGVLAFIFATLAVTRWERQETGARPSARIIWDRFPKFVIAFLLVSAFVTYLASPLGDAAVKAGITAVMNTVRNWLFIVAFLCIGLNTKIRDIRAMGSKPIIAFTTVVLVNFVVGFIMANLLFSRGL